MKACSSYSCAVIQHQRITALFREKCILPCSVLLCNSNLQQAGFKAIHLLSFGVHAGGHWRNTNALQHCSG